MKQEMAKKEAEEENSEEGDDEEEEEKWKRISRWGKKREGIFN